MTRRKSRVVKTFVREKEAKKKSSKTFTPCNESFLVSRRHRLHSRSNLVQFAVCIFFCADFLVMLVNSLSERRTRSRKWRFERERERKRLWSLMCFLLFHLIAEVFVSNFIVAFKELRKLFPRFFFTPPCSLQLSEAARK